MFLSELGTPILFVSVVLICIAWGRFERWFNNRSDRNS